jgi:DNA-binding CsgD family transcriptional regulator
MPPPRSLLSPAGLRAAPSLLTGILFRVFNTVGCGGVLLDEGKRIVHVSGRAHRLVGDGLLVKGECLHAAARDCDAVLQTLIDDALSDGPTRPKGAAVGLARVGKRPLVARVIPVDPRAKPHLEGAAVVVVLLDPENRPELPGPVLQQVFGLTRSEARVAGRLMCGESLQEIARATGLSVGTIRSHTKAVFAKTGTNRQAELVGLLTRLAVISEEGDDGDAAVPS